MGGGPKPLSHDKALSESANFVYQYFGHIKILWNASVRVLWLSSLLVLERFC